MVLRGLLTAACLFGPPAACRAQATATDDRLPVLVAEDFETDADGNGEPDRWYNLRDAERVPGGVAGPTCLKFRAKEPGRPARISRAFGVDGRTIEALRVGLWVKVADDLPGERVGEAPGMILDLLGDDLKTLARGNLGPWTAGELGDGWVRVARRVAVPPGTRDAILTVGLLGATGTLEIDGLSVEAEPRGGRKTPNLVLNGTLELGDPKPAHWVLENGARRVSPGRESDAAVELAASGARALTALGRPVRGLTRLDVRLSAKGTSLRVGGGAAAELFFLDEEGRTVPGAAVRPFRFAGTFDWRPFQAAIDVPRGAARAVFQAEKLAAGGALLIDGVQVESSPNPDFGAWTPYHEADDTERWVAYEPAPIAARSPLDFSALLEAPAGKSGRVVVRQGHLAFQEGGRARFFGVALLAPGAYMEAERADALADRLARSGVNLVRLADLDSPIGPGSSLYDDVRDDTAELDPVALGRLDHLIAALKRRGLYVALELLGQRRFREGDKLDAARRLGAGGGPSAAFDPEIRARVIDAARRLLGHVNPETGLALRDDPVLAWVTIAGERSLFDLIDDPDLLPPAQADALKERAQKAGSGAGRRAWQAAESEQWGAIARALREAGLKAPIAGSAHWRREPEYVAAQAAAGLDLIDDRIYWRPPAWGPFDRRSIALDGAGGLAVPAGRKRRPDRPYVVGEWASHTGGAWALPFEAADLIAATRAAVADDWDALVRRGVAPWPAEWGAAPPGTGGGPDLFAVPEAINANPAVFAMLPHAASLMLRRDPAGRPRSPAVGRGRLLAENAHTVAYAAWGPAKFSSVEGVAFETAGPFAVVAASSIGEEPIARARRLLVTAVGRVEPTGMTWADGNRRDVADPGRGPMLLEPVRVALAWRVKGSVAAHALDSAGRRAGTLKVEPTADGVRAELDTRPGGTMHWELVAD